MKVTLMNLLFLKVYEDSIRDAFNLVELNPFLDLDSPKGLLRRGIATGSTNGRGIGRLITSRRCSMAILLDLLDSAVRVSLSYGESHWFKSNSR